MAAVEVFREGGLGAALREVARVAGVSKETICHRFGGRPGPVDVVTHDLVPARIENTLHRVENIADLFLCCTRMLQFDEPAANDVLLRAMPEPERIAALCQRCIDVGIWLLAPARGAGAIRADLTDEDLFVLIW